MIIGRKFDEVNQPTSENRFHFFFDLNQNLISLWCNLLVKASNPNATEGTQISQFINSQGSF